jgi:hypothetical protein
MERTAVIEQALNWMCFLSSRISYWNIHVLSLGNKVRIAIRWHSGARKKRERKKDPVLSNSYPPHVSVTHPSKDRSGVLAAARNEGIAETLLQRHIEV